MGQISDFIKHNYRHFNAATLVDAAQGWKDLVEGGGKMYLTLAGAMSTGELGISIADLIREDKVHGLCVTGANLEEDIFNLVAHTEYERVPHYRHLTPEQEMDIFNRHLARVTDTCIPEEAAMRKVEGKMLALWKAAAEKNERYFPHEFMYQLIRSGELEGEYDTDPKNSWLLAACEKNLPIWVPGWEDSTLGNNFVARYMQGRISSIQTVKSGLEYMENLVGWYKETRPKSPIGFFQIGGGIAGDFPICAVPLITEDLKEDVPLWSYFCQISDSTTSYGSYSGAVPNEKITWGKLGVAEPKFVIESDATIVFPLVASYVLGR